MITVYTAIFGGRDRLIEPRVKPPDVRFVCYADQEFVSATWEIRRMPAAAPIPASRFFKLLPHRHLADDVSVWIDGNFEITGDLSELAARTTRDLAVFAHPEYADVFEELAACRRLGKEKPEVIDRALRRYREAGMPAGSFSFACGVMVRRHSQWMRAFGESWWSEFQRAGRRDQHCFNYLLWRSAADIDVLPGDIRRNPWLRLRRHPRCYP